MKDIFDRKGRDFKMRLFCPNCKKDLTNGNELYKIIIKKGTIVADGFALVVCKKQPNPWLGGCFFVFYHLRCHIPIAPVKP